MRNHVLKTGLKAHVPESKGRRPNRHPFAFPPLKSETFGVKHPFFVELPKTPEKGMAHATKRRRSRLILKQRGHATSKPVLPSRPAYRREEKSYGLHVSRSKRKPAMAHQISLQGRLYSLTPQPSRWYDYALCRDCEPYGRKRKGRA